MRETAPGDYLRLALYDLEEILRPRLGAGPAAVRHAAIALLAADLQAVPAARAAVLPWLDPDGARTLQAITAQPGHPLRRLWPRGGRLPDALRPAGGAGEGTAPAAQLLVTSYALGLTWCRLAQIAPPAPGFAVPAAAAADLPGGPGEPISTGEMTAWQIIEAARAHLAAGRVPPTPPREQTAPQETAPEETGADRGDPAPAGAGEPPDPGPPAVILRSVSAPARSSRGEGDAGAAASGAPRVVEAYGIRFLCGLDDVERLLTELRRRGQWARRLRGREVSSASTPGLLLVGAPSSGQRRVTRMVSRALAEVGIGGGEVHGLPADRLRERGPDGVGAALGEHAGHTVLLDGLDALILDDAAGAAFAAALYRARVEGVSQTTLVATCGPDRLGQLSAAHPELVTDLRVVHLPDLSDPAARVALLGLLAAERHLELSPGAWDVAHRDLDRMRGRGRLAGARLVESYLDRAATRHLGQAGDTQALYSHDTDEDGHGDGALTLGPEDFDGVAEDLEPALRDLRDVDAYLAELRSLAGLTPVKDAVERIVAEARVAAARRRARLPVADGYRHLGLAGNPGTAKTTVAHLVGKLFAAIGMLESGHVVECTPADLAGAGQVAAKVGDALGGVLVVDRAPELATAVAELTALMDERRDELVVVCTGGPDDLPAFLDAVPAVRERLGEVIVFPDPTDADLVEIFRRYAAQQQYVLDDALAAALPERMAALRAGPGYAAGHSVRRLFDDMVARQSVRIVRHGATLSADQLTRLATDDLP
jgi:SpoVK/Ycf46/Vps4 family AAA+-type ATPase